MKKVFAFLAFAAVMAACNNSADNKENTETTPAADTETAAADSAHQHASDSVTAMPADSIKK